MENKELTVARQKHTKCEFNFNYALHCKHTLRVRREAEEAENEKKKDGAKLISIQSVIFFEQPVRYCQSRVRKKKSFFFFCQKFSVGFCCVCCCCVYGMYVAYTSRESSLASCGTTCCLFCAQSNIERYIATWAYALSVHIS